MQESQWFVIADAARARVLSRVGEEPLKQVCSFEHLASRRKTSELGGDKAGRELGGHGLASAAFSPRTDLHRKEHQRFAQEVAQFLEQEAKAGTFAGVSLFAPSPFLGVLKQELGHAATRRLASTRDIDLSAVGMAELDRRIHQALAT